MKNTTTSMLVTALAVGLALSGCDKQNDISPSKQPTSQGTQDGTIFDLRGAEYGFEGQESTYNGISTNLTNMPAGTAPILMVRTNFIEAANGAKIISQWASKAPVDPAGLGITLPYQWKGKFIDQHPIGTYMYVFDVIFSINEAGVASGKLTWTGEKIAIVAPTP